MEDNDMTYVGPRHAKSASLRVFSATSVYRERSTSSPVVLALAVGALVSVDAYCYAQPGVASPDLSGGAGAQPGLDSCWWHVATGWVADAFLDTSKLAGAPSAAIPAGEVLDSLFLPRDQAPSGGPDDDSALATKAYVDQQDNGLLAKIPTKATTTLG